MSELLDVDFAFQPLYSLHSGTIVAYEALARPATRSVLDLLDSAMREGRLAEVDLQLAAAAVRRSKPNNLTLPLHLNLTTFSVAGRALLFEPLHAALAEAGKRPRDIVLEIGPPFRHTAPAELIAGMRRLRDMGFRIAIDGLGGADLPMRLLNAAPVELVKVDRGMLRDLTGPDADTVESAAAAMEALATYTARRDIRLVANGVETDEQLGLLRGLGIRIAQGTLFDSAPPNSAPAGTPDAGGGADEDDTRPMPTPSPRHTPRVGDFLHPAPTLPADVTCEQVREVLAANDSPTGIIGLDETGRPRWSINRSRFLLAVAGPYGHALHAHRPAERLADSPHVIHADAGAMELLELIADADWGRSGDDVVVVDNTERCLGIVLVTEVVRGVAEAKVEEAAALNPLTRLPGSDTVARDVHRRIAVGEPFVAAWLDVDSFKAVNDTVGFAAGDDLIRELGQALTDLARRCPRVTVSHVGGDDFLIACDVDEITTVATHLVDSTWSAEGRGVTVSLASLVCTERSVGSYREVSRLLAPLKERSKKVPGSSWVLGRPGSDRVEVLRGRAPEPIGVRRNAS